MCKNFPCSRAFLCFPTASACFALPSPPSPTPAWLLIARLGLCSRICLHKMVEKCRPILPAKFQCPGLSVSLFLFNSCVALRIQLIENANCVWHSLLAAGNWWSLETFHSISGFGDGSSIKISAIILQQKPGPQMPFHGVSLHNGCRTRSVC